MFSAGKHLLAKHYRRKIVAALEDDFGVTRIPRALRGEDPSNGWLQGGSALGPRGLVVKLLRDSGGAMPRATLKHLYVCEVKRRQKLRKCKAAGRCATIIALVYIAP